MDREGHPRAEALVPKRRSASLVATLSLVLLASACGPPLVPLTGVVVTPDGSPVANARVELNCEDDPHVGPHVFQETRTDAHGRFVFPEAPLEICYELFIERDADLRRTYYLSTSGGRARTGANLYIRIAPTRRPTWACPFRSSSGSSAPTSCSGTASETS